MDFAPEESDLTDFAWRQGWLAFKLWQQQIPIYNAIRALPRHTEPVVVLCARQFGKSFLGLVLGVEDCIRNEDIAVMIVGPTIDQTVAIVSQSMRILQKDAPPGLIRPAKSEDKWYIGKSEINVGGFDVRMASRKRGRALFRIYIEEVVDSHPDEYDEAIQSDLGPMLTHSKDASMIFLTTLPKIPDHPFITKTIPLAKLKNAFYSYTIDDNKQLNEQQRQACVDRCGGTNTIAYRREYLNEIVRDPSVVVVPPYDEKVHVARFLQPLENYWQTMLDFGGVRDKTVGFLMTYDFLGDVDMVWDERVFGPNTPTSEIVIILREMEAEFKVGERYADAPGQTLVDLNMDHNYLVTAPQKSDWQSSVNSMIVRFQTRKVLIHERCRFLRLSLASGTLNKNKNDFERSEALGHCDALAALMYGIRCLNRDNPWTVAGSGVPQNHVPILPAPHPQLEMAEATLPPMITIERTRKAFGTFRK